MIAAGPPAHGFLGTCWKNPMIQCLIKNNFGMFYSAIYLSELLKNMRFSFQKAKFVAAKHDAEKKWPEILKSSEEKNAYILFGDEASFPPWGTLNDTCSPIGEQPVVETSVCRKATKSLGSLTMIRADFFQKAMKVN